MGTYNVPADLLESYVCLVERIPMLCNMHTVDILKLADARRQEIHDKILEAAGVSRDDQKFAFWLAAFVEGAISTRKMCD